MKHHVGVRQKLVATVSSWMDRISNKEVLAQINEMRIMLNNMWSQKYRSIGHVLRHGELLYFYICYRIVNRVHTNYATLWKEEWLENLRGTGEG